MTVELSIAFDERAIEKLRRIPAMLRLAPSERILKAMGKPILEKAKATAPDSRKPSINSRDGQPTRNKMSKKSKEKWPESARKHLGFVFRKTGSGGYLVIGGKDPLANSLNFAYSDKAGTRILWDAEKVRSMPRRRIPVEERFMYRAFSETRQAQVTAGNNQLEKELRELNLG